MGSQTFRLSAAAVLTLATAVSAAPALASQSSASSHANPAVHTTGTVSAPRWTVLPATPKPGRWDHQGYVSTRGAKIYYAEVGHGSPVFLLHGGPANSDYLARQVTALKSKHRVVVIDTRGHGRSTLGDLPLGYDLFADDVVAVMNHLNVRKADFVGWSDGGITALDLAMRYPHRTGKVMAFGANTNTSGTLADPDKKPAFGAFLDRAPKEYAKLSPTPGGFQKLSDALGMMYATQPDWTDAQLRSIRSKVLIADGDHDEAIAASHTRYIARTIPGARLHIFRNASHFAFLQDTKDFNAVMTAFIG